MPPLNVMIKPASGRCNLRCRYCFYADEVSNRGTPDFGMMSDRTAEQIVKKTFDFADGACSFGFQGGEPTLRGLDFFRRFTELVEKYNRKRIPVSYMLQTNGTRIDESWADFFYENNFLIGLSLDGDKALHDEQRVDADGKGTFSQVQKAANVLGCACVDFNVLTVVTRQTARNIQRIYSFFMKNGLYYQQYIPCIDPLFTQRGAQPYSLKPEDYQTFLIRLFDLWYRDRMEGRFVYIRYFENLAGMLLGRAPESCTLRGQCTRQIVVEADGTAYPCDFYMLDEYKIGSFLHDTVEDMMRNQNSRRFLQEAGYISADCKDCEFGFLCRGGCRRDRQGLDLHSLEKNYFCSAFQTFLPYAAPKILQLIREE